MGPVVVDLSVSVDGFIAGPNDGPDDPLGDGRNRLFGLGCARARLSCWSSRLPSTRPPGSGRGQAGQDAAPRRTNDLDRLGLVCWACPLVDGRRDDQAPPLGQQHMVDSGLAIIPEPECPRRERFYRPPPFWPLHSV